MSDLFADVVRLHRGALQGAALHALHDLRLLPLLRTPHAALELAAAAQLPTPRRLDALLRALSADQLLQALPDGHGSLIYSWPMDTPLPAHIPAPHPAALPGWGHLPSVLRTDQPAALPLEDHPALLLRYHDHLANLAAPLAAALAPHLPAQRLLDLGGGLGGYTLPWLDAHPLANATLLDTPAVLRLASSAGLDQEPRLTLASGDLLTDPIPPGHDLILLANVLHLLGPDDARALLRRAAQALPPGGHLVVRELDLDPDGLGPPVSAWFHLNMAIFTPQGAVHPPEHIDAWMRDAGLRDLQRLRFDEAPQALLLRGSA